MRKKERTASPIEPKAVDPLYDCAMRLAGLSPDKSATLDFAHSVYLRVLNKLRKSNGVNLTAIGVDNLQAYCARVALNIRNDIIRRRRSIRIEPLHESPPVFNKPSSSVDYSEFVAQLATELQEMSNTDQELVRLIFVEGHKISDVVRMFAQLGSPMHYDKVASRIKRLRRRLRDACHDFESLKDGL